ncbi:hypothetical protein EZS27_014403 [termite gut metagenome]|uniref:Uncharacterized protein n=1 Tax=termite gut metagenome TaxID=433724 RepID=A0A5J4RV00_9ZZZZ
MYQLGFYEAIQKVDSLISCFRQWDIQKDFSSSRVGCKDFKQEKQSRIGKNSVEEL